MPLDIIENRKNVFEYIAKSTVYGNLGLFIGAGLPMAILNSDWESVALSWKELITKVSEELKVDFTSLDTDCYSYPEISSKICKIYSKTKNIKYDDAVRIFKRTISDFTSWYPGLTQRHIYNQYFETLAPNWIITTNYDLIIECILTGKGYSLTPDNNMVAPRGSIPVYHLHGIRTNPDSIIITQEDYTTLFRPNQYRQQKLPLILKESLTILIGYNLGDFNVLTAVDWSRNVFKDQVEDYPQDIIQFYHTARPKTEPYRDTNNIIIIEFDDLSKLLDELCTYIIDYSKNFTKTLEGIQNFNKSLITDSEKIADKFLDNQAFRTGILGLFRANRTYLINGFLELFAKAIDLTWERARPNGAFHAYSGCLTMLLDIIEYVPLEIMPPALIEALAFNLNSVASYIGTKSGQSFEAADIWQKRKNLLSNETKIELKNIAKSKNYYALRDILRHL